jgi:hypothetical protein
MSDPLDQYRASREAPLRACEQVLFDLFVAYSQLPPVSKSGLSSERFVKLVSDNTDPGSNWDLSSLELIYKKSLALGQPRMTFTALQRAVTVVASQAYATDHVIDAYIKLVDEMLQSVARGPRVPTVSPLNLNVDALMGLAKTVHCFKPWNLAIKDLSQVWTARKLAPAPLTAVAPAPPQGKAAPPQGKTVAKGPAETTEGPKSPSFGTSAKYDPGRQYPLPLPGKVVWAQRPPSGKPGLTDHQQRLEAQRAWVKDLWRYAEKFDKHMLSLFEPQVVKYSQLSAPLSPFSGR